MLWLSTQLQLQERLSLTTKDADFSVVWLTRDELSAVLTPQELGEPAYLYHFKK